MSTAGIGARRPSVEGTSDQAETNPQYSRFFEEAARNEREVLELLARKDWRKVSKKDGILVQRWRHPEYKRYIYLSEAEVPGVSPGLALNMTFENAESQVDWNPGMRYVKNLLRLNDRTVLTQQVTSPEVAGLISPREMLLLNSWSQADDGTFLVSYASTEWSEFTFNEQYVKAFNGPSGFQFLPLDDGATSTKVRWLFNADFQYSVPSVVINGIMPRAVSNYLKIWKEFIERQLKSLQKNELPR